MEWNNENTGKELATNDTTEQPVDDGQVTNTGPKQLNARDLRELYQKIEGIVTQNSITEEEYNALSPEEKEALLNHVENGVAMAENDRELEEWQLKSNGLMNNQQRKLKWDALHAAIMKAMGDLIKQNHTMPTHSEIAEAAGVHRNTVRVHLREYENSPLYQSQLQQYQFAAPAIIDGIMVKALIGDTKAAKVYLDALPKIRSWQVPGKTEGIGVTIKSLRLTQEVLNELPEKKLEQLQSFVQELLKDNT